tara:strand:+ start:707 stop:886 length:180 start_codon:yes stop_codon:yes gene_type:complete
MALNKETMTEIKITDNKTIEDVQKAFYENLSFLKLEFYSCEQSEGEGLMIHLKSILTKQ